MVALSADNPLVGDINDNEETSLKAQRDVGREDFSVIVVALSIEKTVFWRAVLC